MERNELKTNLKNYLSGMPSRRFALAIIKDPTFGIVDQDRADFLGLRFSIEILDSPNEGASMYLHTEESLELIKEVGTTEKLNGRICWVYITGPGSSTVEFVSLR